MMRWWHRQRLNFKVALGIVVTLVIVLGVGFIGISQYVREQLWKSEIQKTENLNAIAESLLEDAMLAGRKDTIHAALVKLGQNAGNQQLNSLAVYDDQYVLTVFASGFPGGPVVQPESMPTSIEDPSCWGCHQLPAEQRPTHQVVLVEGREVIRNSVPLYNEERCQTCHGTGKRVLGDIMVDYSQDQFRQSYSTIMLGLGGGIVFAIGLVVLMLYQVMRRIVLAPMGEVVEIAEAISHGALERQAEVRSGDEIGVLARAFNSMTAQLRGLIGSLEARVASRTRDLELAAEVGRSASQLRDVDTLLANAVDLIRSRFGLYYVQVYLMDPNQRVLALRAGTGDVGLELKRRAHHLPVGRGSINGRAAAEKRAVIVADTAATGFFKPNPLLPDTRSETAVPLLLGDRVVGVLDLQSDRPGTLSEEHLPAFEALAGQLAVAIDNAGLFTQIEQARAEVVRHARRLTREGWQEFLDAIHRSERLGYSFDQQSLTRLAESLPTGSGASTLDVPVSVVGEAVGRIRLERDGDGDQRWSEDDTQVAVAVAAHLAQQLENLRLLAQAEQYRAEAEAAARRLTREGWEGYLHSRTSDLGYVYDLNQVERLSAAPEDGASPSLNIPVQVQDETIGDITFEGVEHLDPEIEDMIASIAHRLGAHIENLRLSEQVEARAHRDQLLSEITARVHQSSDAESIMRLAVQEIGQAFGRKAFIYLGDGDETEPAH